MGHRRGRGAQNRPAAARWAPPGKGTGMKPIVRISSRRDFLRSVGWGALGTAVAGGLAGSTASGAPGAPAPTNPQVKLARAATEGLITLPGRPGDACYSCGFIRVSPTASVSSLSATYKGKAQHVAPILDLRQETDVYITLTNLGLVGRPDLVDSHTIHWHGFRTPTPLNDGVPEVSVAVPINRQFTYFYRPHNPGTYMYHCHFEDVEHVQMGMTGIVFVRPTQDSVGTVLDPLHRGSTNAYTDGNGATAYDRNFAILLDEIEERQHDADELIQEFIPTNFNPQYFTLNGRVYPQTILPNNDPSLPYQPVSALIQVNPDDRVLLRLANLGYQQHPRQLPGIALKAVGEDAVLRRSPAGVDTSYLTNTLYLRSEERRVGKEGRSRGSPYH